MTRNDSTAQFCQEHTGHEARITAVEKAVVKIGESIDSMKMWLIGTLTTVAIGTGGVLLTTCGVFSDQPEAPSIATPDAGQAAISAEAPDAGPEGWK